mgnify:CR=1 FL=1
MNSNIKQNLADLHQIFALLNWDDTIFTHLSACISDNLLMKPSLLLTKFQLQLFLVIIQQGYKSTSVRQNSSDELFQSTASKL